MIQKESPIQIAPVGIQPHDLVQMKTQAMQAAMKSMYEQKKLEMEIEQAKQEIAANQPSEYVMRIRPGVTGGYAVNLDGELFIASSTEELPNVIIAAIGRKKIKA